MVLSNKCGPLTATGACISSGLTTVIHLEVRQVNYNCFNEPFAVSQYPIILRHAWLSP